jgi:hypothetical protein
LKGRCLASRDDTCEGCGLTFGEGPIALRDLNQVAAEPPNDPVSPLRVPNDPDSWEGILSKLANKGKPS